MARCLVGQQDQVSTGKTALKRLRGLGFARQLGMEKRSRWEGDPGSLNPSPFWGPDSFRPDPGASLGVPVEVRFLRLQLAQAAAPLFSDCRGLSRIRGAAWLRRLGAGWGRSWRTRAAGIELACLSTRWRSQNNFSLF